MVALAQAAPSQGSPNITSLVPRAVTPGKRTTLTFSGHGLDTVSNLWTSFGGTARRLLRSDKDQAVFEVSCPAEATGVQALQLAGPQGATDFQLVLVDPLPSLIPHEDNRSTNRALRLSPPAAVESSVHPEQADYYVFSARAGESFSIEAIAHRSGSDMDPVVQVLDAQGREVAFCDDGPGIWKDARFLFSAPCAGDFLLAVHDAGYGGGGNYHYRLRVTHYPLAWYSFPLIDPENKGPSAEMIGSADRPSAASDETRSPADPPRGPSLGAWPSIGEMEPNDAANQAQSAFIPSIINGKIHRPGDVDLFRFSVEKDQKLIFQSQTRSLGSPCDLVLTLKDPDGKALAQSDPSLPTDAAVTNRFTAAGTCLLEIRELSGNSMVPYRIKVQPFEPGVGLNAAENRLEGRPGESVTVHAALTRFEYDGELQAEVEPKISGITVEEVKVSNKRNEVAITIKLTSDIQSGSFHHFKLRISSPKTSLARFVETSAALKKNFPLILHPPPALEGLFSLTVLSPN